MANLRATCPILPAPWGVGTAEGWLGDSSLPCSPLPRKNSRLQFNKVKLEDAGEYVCEAENILGKDSVRGQLHVNSGRYPTTIHIIRRLCRVGTSQQSVTARSGRSPHDPACT